MEFLLKEKSSRKIRVAINGEIGIENREHIQENFLEVLAQIEMGKIGELIVDFNKLTYIDSMGISYFVKLNKTLKSIDSELIFENTPSVIKNIFSLLSLDSYFNFR